MRGLCLSRFIQFRPAPSADLHPVESRGLGHHRLILLVSSTNPRLSSCPEGCNSAHPSGFIKTLLSCPVSDPTPLSHVTIQVFANFP